MATSEESSPLRCSICFNSKEGRQPRVLPCQHSFCNECLKQWHERRHRAGQCAKTQVECPICRTKSALPSADVSRLPLDINVQQFADYLTKESKSISCQLCKIKEGKTACMMCHVLLCEDCSDEHKKSPLFASHVFTESICERHGAALQCVCTTCLSGVCIHCIKDDLHKGHSLEETSAGIKTIKLKVRKCTGELQELVRKVNLDMTKIHSIEDIKRTLDMIKKEIKRLEKEIADHERLCKAKIDAVFKEYEAHSKLTSAAILNGAKLLDEHDNVMVLNILKTAELPNKQVCSQLRAALFSVSNLDPRSISLSNCRLENTDNALEVLKNCKLVCGIPDVFAEAVTPVPLVQVMKIECGRGCDIKNPGRLCGTPEGDVIVCDDEGGPVYRVYKNGTKTRLLDDGIAACVHGGDVYVISTDGGTVTRIKQDGSTMNHKLKPAISDPSGLAISSDNAFVLTSETIIKQPLLDSDCRETLTIEGCEDLRHLLKISDGGMTKLVVTNWDPDEVIICDEAGSVLTRFGGYGSEDDLLYYPQGISRMSNGHLLVADCFNHRIVEYKMDGTIVRDLTTDGLKYPRDVVYKYPYLWIANFHSLELFRFSH